MEILQSKNDLYENLKKLINENIDNEKLVRNIQKIFMEKNMSLNSFILLSNGTLEPNQLTLEELIAITQGIYDTLKNENIKPERFFKDEELAYFDGYIYVEEDNFYSNIIHLKEFREIEPNKVYSGYLTLEELYTIYVNRLFIYNLETQRAPELKKIGTKDSEDNIMKDKSVNPKSIEDVENLFLKKRYIPDEISFNLRLMKGKSPQCAITRYDNMKTIVDLTIQPNYDRNTNTTTYVDIVDGWHRFNGAVNAFSKHLKETGEKLQGGLTVVITMLNVQDAAEYVARKFIRNDTDKEFTKVMGNGSSIKVAKNLVDGFNFTNDLKIVNTWDEFRVYNAFATIADIESVITQCSKLDVDNPSDVTYFEDEVSEIVNSILTKLINKVGGVEEFKKTDLRGKMIAGYIGIADRLRQEERPRTYINSVVEYLYGLNATGEINKMKMVTANANLNTIYNYFYEMADETVKNA